MAAVGSWILGVLGSFLLWLLFHWLWSLLPVEFRRWMAERRSLIGAGTFLAISLGSFVLGAVLLFDDDHLGAVSPQDAYIGVGLCAFFGVAFLVLAGLTLRQRPDY